jgi:hypothetical protein
VIDETSTDYIITQTFGWLTGILALVKIFFFTVTLLIKKYTKNVSIAFVIIGLLGSISGIIFGIRIDEISIYIRGSIMLVLSIIVFVAKIVFDIEYDKKKKEKEIEMKDLSKNNDIYEIIKKLENLLEDKEGEFEIIKYNSDEKNVIVKKDKIIINDIELEYTDSIIESLIKSSKLMEIDNNF